MKYIKNFACGFTLTEVLISLLISALLASALVPLFGVKKIKYPKRVLNHGIAECYYAFDIPTSTWKLKYYYESSAKNSPSIDTEIDEGTSCTFTAPNAPYFEIIAIGAGGSSKSEDFNAEIIQGDSTVGFLSVGQDFQKTISDASIPGPAGSGVKISQMIRDALNKWAETSPDLVQALYSVTSPLGESAATLCAPDYINFPNDVMRERCYDLCEDGFDSAACDGPIGKFHSKEAASNATLPGSSPIPLPILGCWAYIHDVGRSSAPGMQKNVSVPINGYSTMMITQNTQRAGFSLKNLKDNSDQTYFYLGSSASGASWDGTTDTPTVICDSNIGDLCSGNGTSVSGNSAPEWGTQSDVEFGCSPAISPARLGSVFYNNQAYEWNYTPGVLQVENSTSGQPGKWKSMVYENLTGSLILTPARLNDPQTTVVKSGRTILTADSGTDGSILTRTYNVVSADLPLIPAVKELARPKNRETFVNYLSKLASLNFNGGIGNCADSSCPGFAGSGSYAFVTRLDNAYKLTLTNNQFGSKPSYTLNGAPVEGNNAPGCEGEDELTELSGSTDIKYCKPARVNGNPGAVIIIW